MREVYKNSQAFRIFIDWVLPFSFGAFLGGIILPVFGFLITDLQWWGILLPIVIIFSILHNILSKMFLR